MVKRVWAEFLKPDEIIAEGAVELLARHDVVLGFAVHKGGLGKGLERLLGACGDAGVKVMLWPLLEDHEGYWPGEANAMIFSDFTGRICDWADKKKLTFDWLAIDMEPSISQMNALKSAGVAKWPATLKKFYEENRNHGRFYLASATYNLLVERMHSRGAKVLAAAPEFVIHDINNGRIEIQDLLETPITTVNFDVVSFMIYTSMITGYSKGFVSRGDAARYLYLSMRDARASLWERAGVSIGVTHTGKLQNEPRYGKPEDLEPDIAAAKAALISDISIFCLEGILKSSEPDEWFEALEGVEAAPPSFSLKADAAYRAAGLLAKTL